MDEINIYKMNYHKIIEHSFQIKTQHQLESYLNELFKENKTLEDVQEMQLFKTTIWEEVNKMKLLNEVTDFIGLSAEHEETEFGFVTDIMKPEDTFAGILHWIHYKLKRPP